MTGGVFPAAVKEAEAENSRLQLDGIGEECIPQFQAVQVTDAASG